MIRKRAQRLRAETKKCFLFHNENSLNDSHAQSNASLAKKTVYARKTLFNAGQGLLLLFLVFSQYGPELFGCD